MREEPTFLLPSKYNLLFFTLTPQRLQSVFFFLHRLNACQLSFIVKQLLRDLYVGICNAAMSVIPKTQRYTQKLQAFIVRVTFSML